MALRKYAHWNEVVALSKKGQGTRVTRSSWDGILTFVMIKLMLSFRKNRGDLCESLSGAHIRPTLPLVWLDHGRGTRPVTYLTRRVMKRLGSSGSHSSRQRVDLNSGRLDLVSRLLSTTTSLQNPSIWYSFCEQQYHIWPDPVPESLLCDSFLTLTRRNLW